MTEADEVTRPPAPAAGSTGRPEIGGSKPDPRDEHVDDDSDSADAMRGGLVKALLAVLVNVGVLTAMLVYFGWIRSERMAGMLGIDEAILGMTVDDYVRRSVRSVVLIPVIAAVGGLAWVALDHWWRTRRRRNGASDRLVVFVARWLWLGAIALFAAGAALWIVGYAATYIAAPLVCSGGVLLLLYALSLRAQLPGAVGLAPLTDGVLRGSVAVLVAIGLFWTATNFATVEGTELAQEFPRTVGTLPGVEVDSAQPLDIVAPGVEASCFGGADGMRYRYSGLRLLESTGGKYFLISDGWTPDYGVVVVLPADVDDIRYTFVRDVAGDRGGDWPSCETSDGSEGDSPADHESSAEEETPEVAP